MIATSDQAKAVFLNVPYDAAFERLYLAYVVGLSSFKFTPHTALEIPDSTRRLERIQSLLRTCRYSIHDLSRAQAGRSLPRFNMPFELGLAVGWAEQNADRHSWLVCDSEQGRLLKCISDLNGTDVYIHNGRIDGVMRALCNMFVHESIRPDVRHMMRSYRHVRAALPEIKRRTGANSLFETRIFVEICYLARELAR